MKCKFCNYYDRSIVRNARECYTERRSSFALQSDYLLYVFYTQNYNLPVPSHTFRIVIKIFSSSKSMFMLNQLYIYQKYSTCLNTICCTFLTLYLILYITSEQRASTMEQKVSVYSFNRWYIYNQSTKRCV